jgi:hypothetical protein
VAEVSAALTQTEVQITRDFNGARIVLYGAVFDPRDRPHDVVVVVRGPEQPVHIVRKVRVAGLWLNTPPVEFRGAPGYYMAASTRPLNEVARFAVRRRLRLGVENLPFQAPEEEQVTTRYGVRDVTVNRLGSEYFDYRRAVVRLKQRERLYAADSDAIRWWDEGFSARRGASRLRAHGALRGRNSSVSRRPAGGRPHPHLDGGEGWCRNVSSMSFPRATLALRSRLRPLRRLLRLGGLGALPRP